VGSTHGFYFLPPIHMGQMKRLYEVLQEAEQVLQETDPLAFENAKRIIEGARQIALASLSARPRTIRPTEDQTHIPHCEYCGRINTDDGFRIGAKLATDGGFTMVEGTGKMSCADCYPIAAEEAEKAMA